MESGYSLSQLSIHHVSSRLYLITIPKDVLNSSLKPLLTCIFFPKRYDILGYFQLLSDAFFSYTETEDEVSIVVDAPSLAFFKQHIHGKV